MKSAYELAMERLEKQSPIIKLNDEQKRRIAEINSSFQAKIAERELFLKDQIAKAVGEGEQEEAAKIKKQLVGELTRLREDWEEQKKKVHSESK